MTENKISEQTTLARGSGSNPSSPMAGEPAPKRPPVRVAVLTQCPKCYNYTVVVVKEQLVINNIQRGSKNAPLKNWGCKATWYEVVDGRQQKVRCNNIYHMHSKANNHILAEVPAEREQQVKQLKQVAEVANIQRYTQSDDLYRMIGLSPQDVLRIWNRIAGYEPRNYGDLPMPFRRWRQRRGGRN